MTRRLIVITVVPALLGVVAYAIASNRIGGAWDAATGRAPALQCPHEVNLGECALGKLAAAKFTVSNGGGQTLVIHDIRSTCACAGLEQEESGVFKRLSKLVVPPSAEVELTVRVSVRTTPGEPSRSVIHFATNDPRNPDVELSVVVSKVLGGVNTHPRAIVFGNLPVGRAAKQIVDVFDDAREPRRLQCVSGSAEGFRVKLLQPDQEVKTAQDTAKERLIGRVEVEAATEQARSLDGWVYFTLAGEAGQPSALPVFGRVVPQVTVTPSELYLPVRSASGPVYAAACTCQSSEDKSMSLSVSTGATGLSATCMPMNGKNSSYLVRVTWDPAKEKPGGSGQDRFVLLTASVDGKETPVKVSVRCESEVGRGPTPRQ